MATSLRRAAADLTRFPPLTVGTVALALLALPLFVFLVEGFAVDVHPVVTIGIQWALAVAVVGIAVGWEGLSMAEIGFRRPAPVDALYILVTSVAILAIYTLSGPLVSALGLPV